MRKLVIIGMIVTGLYYYVTWKPSTESIVNDMTFDEPIMYRGKVFHSEWAKRTESISGFIRRIDRHYDENIPIITYDLVITTGDYSDPEIVKVRNNGGGNYSWTSKTKPAGTLISYHTVPASIFAQNKLDALSEGEDVELIAKVSTNSKIKSDSGAFFQLRHNNHKIILVENVK